MTKAREATIDLLASAREPLSASDIHKEVGSRFDQATVYRTLHYLEGRGLVDSFILHCSEHGTERYYTARRHVDGEPTSHRHWFHCEACHRFTDLGECQLEPLMETFESRHGIVVRDHSLYLTGLCPGCAKSRAPKGPSND